MRKLMAMVMRIREFARMRKRLSMIMIMIMNSNDVMRSRSTLISDRESIATANSSQLQSSSSC